MLYAILIPLGLLVGVLSYAFLTFDRLVRIQYSLHRDSWITDGKTYHFVGSVSKHPLRAGIPTLHDAIERFANDDRFCAS